MRFHAVFGIVCIVWALFIRDREIQQTGLVLIGVGALYTDAIIQAIKETK